MPLRQPLACRSLLTCSVILKHGIAFYPVPLLSPVWRKLSLNPFMYARSNRFYHASIHQCIEDLSKGLVKCKINSSRLGAAPSGAHALCIFWACLGRSRAVHLRNHRRPQVKVHVPAPFFRNPDSVSRWGSPVLFLLTKLPNTPWKLIPSPPLSCHVAPVIVSGRSPLFCLDKCVSSGSLQSLL